MMMKIDDFYDFMIYEPFMYLLTVKSDRFSQSATQDLIGMKVYTVGQSSRDPKLLGRVCTRNVTVKECLKVWC